MLPLVFITVKLYRKLVFVFNDLSARFVTGNAGGQVQPSQQAGSTCRQPEGCCAQQAACIDPTGRAGSVMCTVSSKHLTSFPGTGSLLRITGAWKLLMVVNSFFWRSSVGWCLVIGDFHDTVILWWRSLIHPSVWQTWTEMLHNSVMLIDYTSQCIEVLIKRSFI